MLSYAITILGPSVGQALNESGQVAGIAYGNNPPRAFLYSGGAMTDLGTLGGSNSYALALNNNGQVAGVADTATEGHYRAFRYSGGVMTDLGTLGGTYSWAEAINDSGQVVGYAAIANDVNNRAFLHSGGVMTDLGTLGGTSSIARALNDSGQVVGYSATTGNDTSHAFLYGGGVMTDLGTLGGAFSEPRAINDSGQVVGWSHTVGHGFTHAFLYGGGVMTDLGHLGGGVSFGTGLNDSGQVIGYSATGTPGHEHAFRYSGGAMTDLGTLGGWKSYALDINAFGHVVGSSTTVLDAAPRAFLFRDGAMTDLNSLIPASSGVTLVEARKINDRGQILASGLSSSGQGHAVLLTPDLSAELGEAIDASLHSGHTSVPIVATAENLPAWLSAIGGDATTGIPGLAPNTSGTTIELVLTLASGTYAGQSLSVPAGYRVVIQGDDGEPVVFVGASPAFALASGDLVLDGVRATNATDAPTILLSGGHLTIRRSTIEETTGFGRAAILVTGGTLDLGTVADPGGNTIIVYGAGELIRNTAVAAVSALGNTFRADTTTLTSGFALEDRIFHALDAGGGGLVTLDRDGSVYVTAASGSLQRGVDAVASGGTVHVAPGSFAAYNVGARTLTIAFQGGPILTQWLDPAYPGRTALVVTGTAGDDKLVFNKGTGSVDLDVAVNKLPKGTFAPTGRLVVRAGAGDDDVQVAGALALPAWLYGEAGNDRLKGGAGTNVIAGGDGDDLLVGGSNRDLLIGGRGADRIVGNEADDILIAGSSAHDGDEAALAMALAEWTSARDYATRIANLKGTGTGPRSNGGIYLVTKGVLATVFDDALTDVLTGDGGLNWFLLNAEDVDPKKRDKVTDLSAAEFTDDLDFINGP